MIHPLSDVKSKHIGKNTKIWQYSIILEGATIGEDCNINCYTLIESLVKIGNRVTIKPGVFIWDGMTIEDDVMIGPNATFTNDKFPKSKNTNYQMQHLIIKRNASIGANATILGGLVIGAHSLIAAGALVTKDVPERALMKGSPAKCVGCMNLDGTPMVKSANHFLDNKGQKWEINNGQISKI
ncbi:acyltransferase [uncultured Marivirga sp.]|uniref:acyltransferase n=1 Tax=uncultured Marivirga sp. TaxID=1123707 RepID=UPI0030EE9DBF|tara:strand:+ start:110442 stop:110990 length:549 start_codon:yes stop_codon:yes gene_type:complete